MKFTVKAAKEAGFKSRRAAIKHSIAKYEYLSAITDEAFMRFNGGRLNAKYCALCWRYVNSDNQCNTGKRLLGCPLSKESECTSDRCAGDEWHEMRNSYTVKAFRLHAGNILQMLKDAYK